MSIKNTRRYYGNVSVALHWSMAVIIIGLFALGLYMTSLGYYDPWYHSAPWWHKSFGLLLLLLLVMRIAWTLNNIKPSPLMTYRTWEAKLATGIHHLFYVLLLLICLSGYFISTAKGKGIEFFGWFEIPALFGAFEKPDEIADTAGDIHFVLALILAAAVVLHVAGALKHHFIEADGTIKRILWRKHDDL